MISQTSLADAGINVRPPAVVAGVVPISPRNANSNWVDRGLVSLCNITHTQRLPPHTQSLSKDKQNSCKRANGTHLKHNMQHVRCSTNSYTATGASSFGLLCCLCLCWQHKIYPTAALIGHLCVRRRRWRCLVSWLSLSLCHGLAPSRSRSWSLCDSLCHGAWKRLACSAPSEYQ